MSNPPEMVLHRGPHGRPDPRPGSHRVKGESKSDDDAPKAAGWSMNREREHYLAAVTDK